MNCDDARFFESDTVSPGYIDSWSASNCTVAQENGIVCEGLAAMRVHASAYRFTVSPNISVKNKLETVVFDNADGDYSSYHTLLLNVQNCGKREIRLNEIRFYTGALTYYTPVCSSTDYTGVTLPADGAWHTLQFDLDSLLPFGAAGISLGSGKLSEVQRIVFSFEGENADMILDGIRVLPGSPRQYAQSEAEEDGKTGFFERILAWLKSVAERIRMFFTK